MNCKAAFCEPGVLPGGFCSDVAEMAKQVWRGLPPGSLLIGSRQQTLPLSQKCPGSSHQILTPAGSNF